jgi:peptide/nickel transport system ATP-binding protein
MSLAAEEIYFRYDKKKDWILENVSLSIEPGEVVGLLGPSGYGKSTLGKVLAGILKAERGRVLLDNKALPKKCYNPVQLIFQHPELAVNPRWRLRKTMEESGSINDGLRGALGIRDEFFDRFPNELSGGELQRCCVLRVLKPETKFIIADEISTMLDVITQSQIWDVTLDYARQHNTGILAITHNIRLAKVICDRIIETENRGQARRIAGPAFETGSL